MPASAAAIIFAKYPQAGKVKTRLIGTVTAEVAAQIHAICLRHVLAVCEGIDDLDVFLAATPPDADFSEFLTSGIQSIDQGSGDLGERLSGVSARIFELGYRSVVLLGSDCATLTQSDLQTALATLSQADVVIGPAEDGGYYLLGTTRYDARLFEQIEWSTERVYEQTVERVREAGMQYELLRVQRDLDDAADLRALLQADAAADDTIVRTTREKIMACVTESWNDE